MSWVTLSDAVIPLYYVHFRKVYPPRYQMDIWDNPECFLVVAGIGKELYIYVSQRRFDVAEFLEQIKQKYAELMFEMSSRFRSVRGDFRGEPRVTQGWLRGECEPKKSPNDHLGSPLIWLGFTHFPKSSPTRDAIAPSAESWTECSPVLC